FVDQTVSAELKLSSGRMNKKSQNNSCCQSQSTVEADPSLICCVWFFRFCLRFSLRFRSIPRSGFEGRVSLLAKALERGDFSVIVRQVRSEDGGDYRCYVQVGGQKERGTPAATRLTWLSIALGQTRGWGWGGGTLVNLAYI
uniref:Ig-like domain-containing protein n=1 Tax=Seriola dumerili TaxID=41447 RepID=A0A3B4UT21_SERDU